jgi:hypothetical protein
MLGTAWAKAMPPHPRGLRLRRPVSGSQKAGLGTAFMPTTHPAPSRFTGVERRGQKWHHLRPLPLGLGAVGGNALAKLGEHSGRWGILPQGNGRTSAEITLFLKCPRQPSRSPAAPAGCKLIPAALRPESRPALRSYTRKPPPHSRSAVAPEMRCLMTLKGA